MNKRNKHTSQRRVAVYSVNAATERKKKRRKGEQKKKLRDCMVAQTTQRNVFLLSFFLEGT